MKSVALRALRLYPSAWRTRYREELAAVLDAAPVTPFVLFDVLRGALDAHLHPELVPEGGRHMPTHLRSSEIAVFAAWIAFVVAGMSFQKSSEDIMKVDASLAAVNIPYLLIEAGAVVALLAVLAGGVPIALAALRFAFANRRRDVLALFAVPVVSFGVLVVYGFIALQVANGADAAASHPTTVGKELFVGLMGIFLLGAVASTWAVAAAIRRSEVSGRLFRFALVPATVTALAMALMLGAVVGWGLALRAADPAAFNGYDGIFASSTALAWIGNIVVMAVATAVAVAAVLRGFGARASSAQAA